MACGVGDREGADLNLGEARPRETTEANRKLFAGAVSCVVNHNSPNDTLLGERRCERCGASGGLARLSHMRGCIVIPRSL